MNTATDLRRTAEAEYNWASDLVDMYLRTHNPKYEIMARLHNLQATNLTVRAAEMDKVERVANGSPVMPL